MSYYSRSITSPLELSCMTESLTKCLRVVDLSYFSAATGFVCDNVVNFEVALASGDIVQVKAQNNCDLFIGLKEGSNNFGVDTRFDLPTFKKGPMWGGAIY